MAEEGLQVVLVHEGEVAWRDADKGLVVLDDEGGNAFVVFPMVAIDDRGFKFWV